MNTKCERCGCPAQGAPTQKPEAKILRRAIKGKCADCCVVEFMQQLSNMHVGNLLQNPAVLRLPHIQKQFEAVMRAGNAEATPDVINWEGVIEKWNVGPVEKGGLW